MPIYDLFEPVRSEPTLSSSEQEEGKPLPKEGLQEDLQGKRPFFSALAARLFFFVLLCADGLWMVYSLLLFVYALLGLLMTLGRGAHFQGVFRKGWVTLRRGCVCALSLFVALFSPAFGIMIASTYFLMYDQSGIDEVVPSSLKAHLKSLSQ